jgi:integrase
VSKRTKIFDSGKQGVTGLYIDINAVGTRRRFWLKVQDRATGKQVSVPVGEFSPTFGRDEARRAALKLRGETVTTIAAAHAAKVADDALTFDEVCDRYIAYISDGVHRPVKKSRHNVISFLRRPRKAFGSRPVSSITAADIAAVLRGILEEVRKERATNPRLHVSLQNQVRAILYGLFRWSTDPDQGYTQINPCAQLGARKYRPAAKDRALDAAEIKTLWSLLDSADCPCDRGNALGLQFILATALRPGGEVADCQRSELKNLDQPAEAFYAIPAARVKKNRPIEQPLNSVALGIIRELYALGDSKQLFGRRGSRVTRKTLEEAARAVCAHLKWTDERKFTPHDLRRTAATLLGNNGVTQSSISLVLDHAGENRVTAIYDRANRRSERRVALNRLAELLRGIINPDAAPQATLATKLQALLDQGLDETTLAAKVAALVAPAGKNVVPLRRVA